MTNRETVAYLAGLRDAAAMARAAAIGLDAREDRDELRQRAAAAALRGFADTLGAEASPEPVSPAVKAMRLIAEQEGDRGEIECPRCKGRLHWARVGPDRHIHANCDTPRCLSVMQ